MLRVGDAEQTKNKNPLFYWGICLDKVVMISRDNWYNSLVIGAKPLYNNDTNNNNDFKRLEI